VDPDWDTGGLAVGRTVARDSFAAELSRSRCADDGLVVGSPVVQRCCGGSCDGGGSLAFAQGAAVPEPMLVLLGFRAAEAMG
jgi:hypothetical protein